MEKYLEYFYEIASIPHGSGNTYRISDYLKHFAQENGFYVRQDENDNIVIIREAHPDYTDHPPVILQGHMDMVTVKENTCHKDMKSEGLDLYVEDGKLMARGTSLGGDDGIAVAYILDILSGDYKAPRIEAVITVDEEVGMLGASALDTSDLTARRMINIDQEEEGIFIASCAGGARVDIDIPVNKSVYEGPAYTISVSGLKGGHSGTDIDKKRGNGINILASELCKLSEKLDFNLVEINGGVADNAIPNEVTARIMLTGDNANSLFEGMILALNGMELYFGDEVNFDRALISISKDKWQELIALDIPSTKNALKCISSIPYGIQAMSEENPSMVETSLNPGILISDEDFIRVSTSVRSSVDAEKKALIFKLISLAREYKASYDVRGDYPGWAYTSHSGLRDIMVPLYKDMFGKEPSVEGIHAGLECGIFSSKIEGLDCISIGPDIMNIHSVNEYLPLDSAKRCFDFLVAVLERL